VDEYPTDEIPDAPSAGDATRDSDLRDVVQRALDRLPRQMRAAVMLRFYDDMTEPEVAAALGVSVGTVKSTVARAVAKLRNDAELGLGDQPGLQDPSLDPYPAGGVNAPLVHGTITCNKAPGTARVWLARVLDEEMRGAPYGQHDDGFPADGHLDHAVRHDGVRR
jgi:hypothetical protein